MNLFSRDYLQLSLRSLFTLEAVISSGQVVVFSRGKSRDALNVVTDDFMRHSRGRLLCNPTIHNDPGK